MSKESRDDTNLPTVVVLGATGFLGPAIVAALTGRARVVAGGRQLVDVCDRDAVEELIQRVQPQAIINTVAAGTGENAIRQAEVNVVGAGNVAAAATGTRLVHVSTDVVHDGTAAPYLDDAEPSPLGSYGTSKADGEAEVAVRHPAAAIVRPSLIWDPARIDPPTVGFAERLRTGSSLTLWDDVFRQPVLADDLAGLLVVLALDAGHVGGTLNAGGADVVSRAQFGRLLLTHFAVPGRERMTTGHAPAGVPTDIRLRVRVAAGIGMAFRGVHEILRNPEGEMR